MLKEDTAWGLGILNDLIAAPALPAAKLDEERGRWMVDLSQRLDVPRSVAQALYPQLVYGYGNPWGATPTARSPCRAHGG